MCYISYVYTENNNCIYGKGKRERRETGEAEDVLKSSSVLGFSILI